MRQFDFTQFYYYQITIAFCFSTFYAFRGHFGHLLPRYQCTLLHITLIYGEHDVSMNTKLTPKISMVGCGVG